MNERINLAELRQRGVEARRTYPAGMVTEHLAVVEVSSEALLALVEAVEAAEQTMAANPTLSGLGPSKLHAALARFDFSAATE